MLCDFHLICTFVHSMRAMHRSCSLTSPAFLLTFASPMTGKQPQYGACDIVCKCAA